MGIHHAQDGLARLGQLIGNELPRPDVTGKDQQAGSFFPHNLVDFIHHLIGIAPPNLLSVMLIPAL